MVAMNQQVGPKGFDDSAQVDIAGAFQGIHQYVETRYGRIRVTFYGDRTKTPCIAYHEVGLNHQTCFQTLLIASGSQSLMMKNFYMIFIDAPGCEVGKTMLNERIYFLHGVY